MKQHNVLQGSPEWLALRAQYFTASEAPAMMGCHPTKTRTQLLHEKHTGLQKEVSSYVEERVFAPGHETEAKYRPIAESIVGDDLYAVTGSAEIESLKLLASFDGLTMDEEVGFEHKLWSEENSRAIEVNGEPPMYHVWQMEHQLLVSGAKHILFATSNGTVDQHAYCWYASKPERRAALIAGWKQFAVDLANYTPPAATPPKPTGHAPDTLPALRIEVTGMVTASNLAEFKATALSAIRGVNRELTTDQDFADAEKAVKWCADVESRLEAAKAHALSQTSSIDELFRTIDDIASEARRTRIDVEKLVKARKDMIRSKIVRDGVNMLAHHVKSMNERLGMPLMPSVPADFAGVIKSKRSIDSITDAVSTELARAKIWANETADRIQLNIRAINATGLPMLFADLQSLVTKAPDDLAAIVDNRVAQHNAREAEKQESERQRIREEEQVRADKEAREKLVAEESQAQSSIQQAALQGVITEPVAADLSTLVAENRAEAVAGIDARQAIGEARARAAAVMAPPVSSGALIKLGDINARIAPLSISADGLAELGFVHIKQEKASKLYRESDFPAICAAMVRHLNGAAVPA